MTQKGYEYNLIQLNEDLILKVEVNVLNDGFALSCNCFPLLNDCHGNMTKFSRINQCLKFDGIKFEDRIFVNYVHLKI